MDGNRVFVRVEDDDFEQLSGSVRADEQEPIRVLGDRTQRHTNGVADVFVRDAVLASAVRDLQG